MESIISKLARNKFSIFQLVLVAEHAGLGMAWVEAPKTGFLKRMPIPVCACFKKLLFSLSLMHLLFQSLTYNFVYAVLYAFIAEHYSHMVLNNIVFRIMYFCL